MTAQLLMPVVDAATRRAFLTALAASGVLAACAPAAPTGPAAQTTPYVGPFGPVDIPVQPQRVVTMYATDTDYALVLGLPVVGASSGQASVAAFPPYHADRLGGVTPLVTFPDPDYESIAALRPDLLFHGSLTYSPDQAQPLSAIAPVYAFPEALDSESRWRPLLAEAAALFERDEAATAFVAAYDERAAAVRERVQARWGGARIAYVGPIEPGVFYVAQANMQTNYVLHEDLGMPHASAVPATVEERRTDISYEEMGLLADADVLLLRVNNAENSLTPDRTQVGQITSAPLWGTLPAVTAGAVFEIPGDLFYTSPITAEANLDWVEQNLLGT
jgi:iron complex transport system substrate-binding protein